MIESEIDTSLNINIQISKDFDILCRFSSLQIPYLRLVLNSRTSTAQRQCILSLAPIPEVLISNDFFITVFLTYKGLTTEATVPNKQTSEIPSTPDVTTGEHHDGTHTATSIYSDTCF